jgi:hypothetical protein
MSRDDALTAGYLQEVYGNNTGEAILMDLSNNKEGARIGSIASRAGLEDEWGFVMNQCDYLASSGQLYGLSGILGGYQ